MRDENKPVPGQTLREKAPGFSLYLCVGKSGGLGVKIGPYSYGLHLWCVSVQLVTHDIERAMGLYVEAVEKRITDLEKSEDAHEE